MKTKIYIACMLATGLLASGCGKFVRDELITMQNEIDQLHRQVEEMKSSLASLRTIVDQMAAGGYIVDVREFTDEDGRGGFVLEFNDGRTVTLYSGVDGKDGEDAYPQIIGIAQDEDGEWYWTLDGKIYEVEDEEGNLIRFKASGRDGVTPKIKVEDGCWWVKWTDTEDEAEGWEKFGEAKGEDAVEIFTDIDTSDENKVVLTLADGTELVLPRQAKLAFDADLVLSVDEDNLTVAPDEVLAIKYAITGADADSCQVFAGSDGFCKVSIDREDSTVYVSRPDTTYNTRSVFITLSDGKGYSKVKVLQFGRRYFNIPENEYPAEAESSVVIVPFNANFKHVLTYSEGGADWVHEMTTDTKAAAIKDTMVFKLDANEGTEVRTCTVSVCPEDHPDYVFTQFTIIQMGVSETGSGDTGSGEGEGE